QKQMSENAQKYRPIFFQKLLTFPFFNDMISMRRKIGFYTFFCPSIRICAVFSAVRHQEMRNLHEEKQSFANAAPKKADTGITHQGLYR
ncbi:MAG: hypothetical protein ACI4RV_01970, partial [Eubacteriales bacterium]